MERKPKASRTTSFVLSLIFGSLVLYVAAYFICVQPASASGFAWYSKFSRTIEAEYRLIGSSGNSLFAPIHAIDRKIRPDTWMSTTEQIERSVGVQYED